MRRIAALLLLFLLVAAKPRTVELEGEAQTAKTRPAKHGDPFAFVGYVAAIVVAGVSIYLSRRQHGAPK